MIHLNESKFTIVTNQYTSPFKNVEKSTLAIERLKADKEPKFTVCGKEFQTEGNLFYFSRTIANVFYFSFVSTPRICDTKR